MIDHAHDEIMNLHMDPSAFDGMDSGYNCSSPELLYNPLEECKLYELVPGRLSFAAHRDDECTIAEIKKNPQLFFFSSCWHESYEPLCADFGPINLSGIHHFFQQMCQIMTDPRLTNRHLVFYSELSPEHMTNGVFLLCAFLVVIFGWEPEDAIRPFSEFNPSPFLGFRDATFTKADYHLSILDCLNSLKQALRHSFLCTESFNIEEYNKLYSPEFDMNQPCSKFLAFRGPSQRPQDGWAKPPSSYIEVLKSKGVTAVVRLNEPDTYDPEEFRRHGIAHYDLEFDDCTVPSADVVARFLDVCDSEAGVIAVHCKAGLGRTGTLIAIWMMKHYGLRADEAMAWLRIVRPGSVIGPQQHFLKRCEGAIWHGNHLMLPADFHAGGTADAAASKSMAAQIVNAMALKRVAVQ
mmetsp:Transcript_31634/g.64134  ORF Transcript_31634/g.64134 Transcript_31634/m.64134 type:complete len:408 (-) Transcript_31634:46-1269(-)